MGYSINTNYLEIVSGTSNQYSSVYKEAASNVEANNKTGLAYLKNFITSIENIDAKAATDADIKASKGNIRAYKQYDNIKFVIDFLSKNLGKVATVKECIEVFDALEKYQAEYTDGYDKKVRLIELEYESAVYMLTSTLSLLMATKVDFVANGTEIKIQKKNDTAFGITENTIAELAKQLSKREHKQYLEALNEAVYAQGPKTEAGVGTIVAAVGDTLGLIGTVLKRGVNLFVTGVRAFGTLKKTVFGIIPLIRSVVYLKWKRKANKVLSLDQQCEFIKQNIDILNKNQTIDPKKKEQIIKKQQAACEAYAKKAAKLRAQFAEGEKEAATAIAAEDPKMKEIGDGEIVLEAAVFAEAAKNKTRKEKSKLTGEAIIKYRDEKREAMRSSGLSKQKESLASDSKMSDAELQKKIQKAYEIFFNNTKKKSIRLKPGKGSKTDDDLSKRTDTKIGGNPYWPVSEPWPTTKIKDKPIDMICYAQLNLDKLPSIPGYPSKGLLQFFIADEEYWGAEEPCKVVYRTDTSEECIKDYPRTTLKNTDQWASIDEVYFPTASVEDQPMTAADDEFDVELCKALNEVFGTSYKRWIDIPKNIDDAFWKEYKKIDPYGCRIGGNPYFTQSDARDDHYTELLLQLDSESGMMWGDCGIANFFISKDDLVKKKFDDVYFTWDCC